MFLTLRASERTSLHRIERKTESKQDYKKALPNKIALFFHAQESMQNSIVLDKVVKTRPSMVFEVRNE